MKEETIRILKVEPGKTPEVCVIQNTLEALQQAVSGGNCMLFAVELKTKSGFLQMY